jgi:hypothetical protein
MNGIAMDSSNRRRDTGATDVPAVAPREERLETVAQQIAAIDTLIALAQERICVFDMNLSRGGWNSAARHDALAHFLRVARHGRLEIIVHDTAWIESSCPRLLLLLRRYGHAVTIYKTGSGARSAMDPLVIVDNRHFLHRYHINQSRATLVIDMPVAARPLVTRFEEIWATGEPGLTPTVLGL